VLSYNAHDLLDDPDATAHVLRSCRPDVACLQEVPRRPLTRHRVERLARESGLVWSAGGRGSGGTAVFTSRRVDVLHGRTQALPVAGPLTRTRGYALARVRLPGSAPLTVVSVHLPLRPAERLQHIRTVLRALPDDEPHLVAGALNEPPTGPVWAALTEHLRDVGADRDEPTYPAASPRRRIDGLLVSPGLVAHDVRVVGASEHLSPEDLRSASDHLPLLAEVELPPAQA
jgi:endonuclease/exonuclease/phosphatase family metal-dependent hydrolase